MQHGFEDIAFATPEKFQSLFKWSRRSGVTAQGSLAVSAGRLLFVGLEGKIEIRNPRRMAVVRGRTPWLYFAIGNAVLLLHVLGSAPHSLAPDNPVTWLLFVAINVLVIVLYRRETWVEIEYGDEKGQPQQAYFTTASQLRWWPSPESVEQLCEGIRSAMQANASGEPDQLTPTSPALNAVGGEQSVTLVCERCGKECVFLARHFGTVQQCPHCNAYVDVDQADE
jgi:hypothetical protein